MPYRKEALQLPTRSSSWEESEAEEIDGAAESNDSTDASFNEILPASQDAALSFVGYADTLREADAFLGNGTVDIEQKPRGPAEHPYLRASETLPGKNPSKSNTSALSMETPGTLMEAKCSEILQPPKFADFDGTLLEWSVRSWSETLPGRLVSNRIFYPFSEPLGNARRSTTAVTALRLSQSDFSTHYSSIYRRRCSESSSQKIEQNDEPNRLPDLFTGVGSWQRGEESKYELQRS